jgi:hypothetical protein
VLKGLKVSALAAPKLPSIDEDPYRAYARTELDKAEIESLEPDAAEERDDSLERPPAPLRWRIARATASAVFAFVAVMLLLIVGVHAQSYRDLAQAWSRVVASHGAVAKSAASSPVWTPAPSVRGVQVASIGPVVRTASRPRATRHASPKVGAIIREVPF